MSEVSVLTKVQELIREFINNLDLPNDDPQTTFQKRIKLLNQWGEILFSFNQTELYQLKRMLIKTGSDCQTLQDMVEARLS